MDIGTLIIGHRILGGDGVRETARAYGRSPAGTLKALKRLEEALSISLGRRAGTEFAVTLEARQLLPILGDAAALAQRLLALSGDARSATLARSVSIEALRRFRIVVEMGSIRSGARHLLLGQPQMSRQLAHLEKLLGYPLLVRHSAGVSLTLKGGEVIVISKELEHIWTQLTDRANVRFKMTQATAKLGSIMPSSYQSTVAVTLAELLARWRKTRRREPIYVTSATADELLAGLRSGRFDVALIDTEDFPADFEGALLRRAGLVLIGRRDLLESGLQLADLLTTAPLAVPSARNGWRQQIDRVLASTLSAADRELVDMLEIDSIPVIVNLAFDHGYCAILPESAFSTLRDDIGILRLDPRWSLSHWLVWPLRPASRKIGHAMASLLEKKPNLTERAE